ncbi:hypothetical protein ACQPZX_20775 [Actinoplanes sp. CA-142083]|uniref:hypothetical protein n=1 Tax=Actinoplanes sp. CA-142083 TaxID=3239903 RepID=UPI003D91909E
MIISIWVIIAFLLLPAGSFRYWTVAFVAVLLVVGVGDLIPARALLTALLALHVLFVVPAAARSGQRRHLTMGLVSAALLAWLVIAGGVRYWLPALIIAALVVPFGVPLLWRRPRRTSFEVRFWPRGRTAGDPRAPLSAQHPKGTAQPAGEPGYTAPDSELPPDPPEPRPSGPPGSPPAGSPAPGNGRRPHRPGLPTQGGSRRPRPPGSQGNPPAGDAGSGSPATDGDSLPPGSSPTDDDIQPPSPPSARNTRSFPPGQRPDRRPAAQPRPPRRRKPPPTS